MNCGDIISFFTFLLRRRPLLPHGYSLQTLRSQLLWRCRRRTYVRSHKHKRSKFWLAGHRKLQLQLPLTHSLKSRLGLNLLRPDTKSSLRVNMLIFSDVSSPPKFTSAPAIQPRSKPAESPDSPVSRLLFSVCVVVTHSFHSRDRTHRTSA